MKNFSSSILLMGTSTRLKNLSLITFNTLGTPFFAPDITKRYRKISQIINSENYDIVCLQEIFTYYHLFLFKKWLTNFPYVLYQKNPLGPRGGLVIFSKHTLTDPKFKTYKYPKNTHVPLYTKIAQLGILSACIKDYSVRLYTTHLSSDTVHNLSPKNKLYKLIRSQSEEAATVLNQYAKDENSSIMAGDFNIAKKSELYQTFITNSAADDVFFNKEKKTYNPQRIAYFYKADSDTCDFIFIKQQVNKIKTLSTNYLFERKETLSNGKKSYLSDHIGLHCILSVNK